MPYKDASKRADYLSRWRADNRERRLENCRKWRVKHPGYDAVHGREWYGKNKDRFREAIFKFFGEKCARCGFSDKRVLQLDHINGRGGKGRLCLSQRYALLMKNPDKAREQFQVLCANCNVLKAVEMGENKGASRRSA